MERTGQMMLYLLTTCQVLLAGVFVLALASKVRGRADFGAFTASIRALGLLSGAGSAMAAYALVAAEAVVVLLLLFPSTVIAGLAGAGATLTVMTAGILAALRRGRRGTCRCFGASDTPLGRVHVVRNLFLITGAATGLAAGLATAGTESPAHPAGLALAAVVAAVGILIVVRLDDLVALFTISSR
jgi:hypothetical protein